MPSIVKCPSPATLLRGNAECHFKYLIMKLQKSLSSTKLVNKLYTRRTQTLQNSQGRADSLFYNWMQVRVPNLNDIFQEQLGIF